MTAATVKTLSGQPPVQIAGSQREIRSIGRGHCIPVFHIAVAPAEATRAVSRSQRDRIIQEEERCPRARPIEWVSPSLVLEKTRDPERPTMMTGEMAAIIDQTAPVTGEHPSLGDGM